MESKFKDRNGAFEAPLHWTSNEVWPDAVVSDVVRSGGDSAVVVGSANISTIAPLIPGLKGVSIVDVEPGQVDIFASRMYAAEQVLGWAQAHPKIARSVSTITNCYYQSFGAQQPQIGKVELLRAEAHVFDLLRPGDFHYTTSIAGLERLRSLFGNIALGEFRVDITKPDMARYIMNPPMSSRVGWVHVSNVAMTEYRDLMRTYNDPDAAEKCAYGIGNFIIDFVGGLKGVDDDTVVTYACYDPDVRYGDQIVPVVSSTTLASLCPAQLLSAEDRIY